jgi:tetratricopeptide (TPR) repeat protein
MIYIAILLTYLFRLLGAISALLLGVSFTKSQRKKYPILQTLSGKQLHLLLATVVFLLLAYGAGAWKDVLSLKPAVELTQGPRGALAQKATPTGFKKELEEAASELASEAEDYFNAAERDFAAIRYRDAASNYEKSISVLPTMSGYLNLGISLLYASHFRQAEAAFISGLQVARKKADAEFEGAFVGNIGNVYSTQGKLAEALKSYQAALAIHKQIGNPLGEASVLGNIGIVYSTQGKLEEALESYQAALEIDKQIGNPLGEANALGNIGNVYFTQGKLEEALKSHQAALEIHKQIGNPLGEAHDLVNIGLMYAEQGKKREALKLLRQARATYLKIGARTSGLQIAEKMIEQLNATM